MNNVRATKRSLAGLLAVVSAAVIAQSAGAAVAQKQYRYHDGQWILSQRYHPVTKATARQYRYHEGQWILVASSHRAQVAIALSSVRPDDRVGVRGI